MSQGDETGELPRWQLALTARFIQELAYRYIEPWSLVADVTWGQGNFWRLVLPHLNFYLAGSDIEPRGWCHLAADFRKLPYRDKSLDVVVFDPPYLPYAHASLDMQKRYRTALVNMSWARIMDLYEAGILEARRVLRDGGQLWVKGMNLVSGGKYRDSERRIQAMAEVAGFELRDRFEFRGIAGLQGPAKPSFLLIFSAERPGMRWRARQP